MTAPQIPLSLLVPVIAHAVAAFEDERKATHWLSSPLIVLGGRTPTDLMESEEGTRRWMKFWCGSSMGFFLSPALKRTLVADRSFGCLLKSFVYADRSTPGWTERGLGGLGGDGIHRGGRRFTWRRASR